MPELSSEATTNRSSQPASKVSSPPAVSLPKGGGAIRGIGEKLAANPVTGSGSLSVPISTSPGRSGFSPDLSLHYDSGASNGPFGFGWRLSLPSISRKTDKGLPRYLDIDESDTFMLSGAEDLVPMIDSEGARLRDEVSVPGYRIDRYRPRVEGLFARIERWTHLDDPTDVFWRTLSRDNVLSIYGRDPESRIFDPADPRRIFSWLICETVDDRGNGLAYSYKVEDGAGVQLSKVSELSRGDRDDPKRAVQRYIKSIRYGNRAPLLPPDGRRPLWLDPAQIENTEWLFEVVFDYGEHSVESPTPGDSGEWLFRADPFSTYRAGFEIRTTRLCKRVLMFHHFKDEPGVGESCWVRSTEFEYSHELDPQPDDSPTYTFLRGVTHVGLKRRADGYLRREIPPLELEYSRPVVQDRVEDIPEQELENLPIGVDGQTYRWVDLYGESIPGILTEQADSWFYKRNLSPLGESVRFGPSRQVAPQPNARLAEGAELVDLAADGRLDVAVLDGPNPGFFEHDGDDGWLPFRPFQSRLSRDLSDPSTRLVDLTGDGRADVLITEDDGLIWHPSLAEQGFGRAERGLVPFDEQTGPRLVFADRTDSIFLADLSGDGLADLARVRNGEVCYWPNLGYGRFGAKITMDRAPVFDFPEAFDPARIRLADIDGSGTTDILYLHTHGARLYFNQSGNAWSPPKVLEVAPEVDELASIQTTDLLGNGTSCLVWSSRSPATSRRSMRYVDLMGGQKPHLLVKTVNNMGAETRLHYSTSTHFYLRDEQAGRPWITRLPFPVHVVERMETYDHISGGKFVTRYAYHHGHFDGAEREFRGFGRVDQWDTEEVEEGAEVPGGSIDRDGAVPMPPVLTKTWFHTGAYMSRNHISDYFAGLLDGRDVGEYYREPGLTEAQARDLLLPDTVLPDGLSTAEEKEACRTLQGAMLRQEVYALDGSAQAEHPYSVVEQSFAIRKLQSPSGDRPGVFFSHPREAVTYQYERNPADPRIQHGLTLEVDAWGHVLKEAGVGYGRRLADPELPLAADRAQQSRVHITYSESRFTHPIQRLDCHRAPLLWESKAFELTGYSPSGPGGRFRIEDFVRPAPELPGAWTHDFDQEIAFEDQASIGRQRRLVDETCTFFRPDDLGVAAGDSDALLPPGEIESLALPGESYRLALTPSLIDQVFQRDGAPLLAQPQEMLGSANGQGAGYVDLKGDGRWWVPSGRAFYSIPQGNEPVDPPAAELAEARGHFFLGRRFRDPFGQFNTLELDAYDLLIRETRDPVGNRITVGERLPDGTADPARAGNDYRTLTPWRVTDANGNRTEVAFDALGQVVGTAVMGKAGENLGDSLDGFEADLSRDEIQALFRDPAAADLLGRATTRSVYDLFAFQRGWAEGKIQPAGVCSISRETHDADLAPGEISAQSYGFVYSDGFGRDIQRKTQAEPGPVPLRDPAGNILVGDDGQPVLGESTSRRWVGSGWTVYNNKGLPARRYEPFFSDTHGFDPDTRIGNGPTVFYDPLGRSIATLYPNETYVKTVFDPWQQETWDANDTVLRDPRTDPDVSGYVARHFEALGPEEAAAWQGWHSRRVGGALGPRQQEAAVKAAAHADTPTTTTFDSLGRAFLTLARNRVVCPGHPLDGTQELTAGRVELDIEGNPREARDGIVQNGDARGRKVETHDIDLLGQRIRGRSMEGGSRWTLTNVAGNPILSWDSRGHRFRTEYDALQRPLRHFVSGTDAADPDAELLIERSVYGEQHPQAEALNLRSTVYLVLDQAGAMESDRLDFKGNALGSRRRLAVDYKQPLDWSPVDSILPGDPSAPLDMAALEAALGAFLASETYVTSTAFDALNRPVSATSPDGSTARPVYNEAQLLESLEIHLKGSVADGEPIWTPFVLGIDYDAKGRRRQIEFGNGTRTSYEYDPLTSRLRRLRTERDADLFPQDCPLPPDAERPGCGVQSLSYTYDPVGNVTHIHDHAQQAVFFNNQRVEPSADYTYDASYRLVQATGREHLGQGSPPRPHDYDDRFRVGLAHPGDGQALGTYVERYVYDPVGNLLELQHRGTSPAQSGWNRIFEYSEPSRLEPTETSNRLSRAVIGQTEEVFSIAGEGYDPHGNLLHMPHLSRISWDFRDQMRTSQRQSLGPTDSAGIARDGERTYYVYDASGERVRKLTELENGNLKDEWIYLGGLEIYRKHSGPTAGLARETLHVMDNQSRIAMVETRVQGQDAAPAKVVRYQLGNHLGSTSLELDELSRVLSYEEFSPYGSTTYQAARSDVLPKRYRYTGMERDEESGLAYHGARYYAPWLARWTAADPAGLVDGTNSYRYSKNNPVGFRDPGGRQTEPPKVGPIRDGMLIGDDPGLSHQWQKAVEGVLQRRYGKGSYEQNLKAFHDQLNSLPKGSNRQKGTAIHLARRVFNAANNAFRRRVALPKGTQVHHSFEGLAQNPANSLNASGLQITQGKASTPGSSHHRAHRAEDLRQQPGVKNPGRQATQEMNAARSAQKPAAAARPTAPSPAPAVRAKPATPAPAPAKPAAPAPAKPAVAARPAPGPRRPVIPVLPKGTGGRIGVGVIGWAAWTVLAVDLAEAKTTDQRVDVATGAAEGMATFWAISKIPYVGKPVAGVAGAAMTGYATGEKIAKHVIPDETNIAVGETIVHDVIGASRDDVEILQEVDILDAAAEGLGGAIVQDLFGATPDDFEALQSLSIGGFRPFGP